MSDPKTAFVTGITGQDGGYLAERLLSEGVSVHGLIHTHDEHTATLERRSPQVVLHEGDLTDSAGVQALVSELEPDEIYNLGGISSVAFSWEQPLLTAAISGVGAVAVLEAAWRLQTDTGRPVRVLQASSAEIFGDPAESPQSESTPIKPTSPYGVAKAFAHHMTGVYRSRGLHASGVILYNHESPRRPTTFVTRKITQAAARIAAGEQETLVLGNLDARRDWGWAPDYVDAMVRAVRHDSADDYVIATGQSRTVGDFVAAAFAHAGMADWRDHVVLDEAFVRPMDAVEQCGDASKARSVLGWSPSVDFEQMVRLMVDADLADK
jgi:GDPmannose 4,6-dehydratase